MDSVAYVSASDSDAEAPPGAEAAGEVSEAEAPEAEEPEEHENGLYGGTGSVVEVFGAEPSTLEGGGLFGALTAAHGWFEVELEAKVLSGTEGIEVPVVVFVKKPFKASKSVHPFVGLGGGASMLFGEEAAVHPEVEAVGGSYVWFGPHAGLVAALAFGAVFEAEILPEIAVDLGPVVRF